MRTIRAFVKSRPLLSYYALVFAISWGGALLVIGGPNAIPGTEEQYERLLPFAILALLAIGEKGEHFFAWQRQAHGRLEDVREHAPYCSRRHCSDYWQLVTPPSPRSGTLCLVQLTVNLRPPYRSREARATYYSGSQCG